MFFGVKTRLNQLKAKRSSADDSDQASEAERLLPFYVGMMTKLANCERCSVFIHDSAQERVWLKVGTGVGEREIEIPKEGSIVGDVISSGKSVIINDVDVRSGAHKLVDDQTGYTTRNILCVPIKSIARDDISGAFQLLNKIGESGFTNEDLVLAEEIADHLKKEVDTVYLDQEMFVFTERLYSSFLIVVTGLAACFAIVVAACLALLGGLLSVA